MYEYSRYRRSLPSMVEPARRRPGVLGQWIKLILVLGILFFAGRWILGLFSSSNNIIRAAVVVQTEDTGTVNVVLEGGETRRAEDGMKMYAGERLSTEANGHASLTFFDGTRARLDENTEITVESSDKGDRVSTLIVHLEKGSLWVTVPTMTLSGSIVRQVKSDRATFELPSNTQALIGPTSVVVYAAAGEGVALDLGGKKAVIGEGQQFVLPADTEPANDLYAYRSPLSPDVPVFVQQSRQLLLGAAPAATSAVEGTLTVTEPANGAAISRATFTVAGKAPPLTKSILINGYPATLNATAQAFSQDISFPEGRSEFDIKVQALDADGEVIAEIERIVRKSVAALAAPTITVPAKDGETYRTQRSELVIRGTAPKGAVGMMVNEYKLQLFDPAKGEWSYLASLALGNLKAGTNTYDVYALYDDGTTKSDPVRLTILHEAGTEGIVGEGTPTPPPSTAASSSAAPIQNNPPLTPGILAVTLPAAGTSAKTGTGVLIEGTTAATTDSIWVNDYRLQLYQSGKPTWNYYARPDLQNLKRGENKYVIIARNKEGQVLDRMEYVITFEP